MHCTGVGGAALIALRILRRKLLGSISTDDVATILRTLLREVAGQDSLWVTLPRADEVVLDALLIGGEVGSARDLSRGWARGRLGDRFNLASVGRDPLHSFGHGLGCELRPRWLNEVLPHLLVLLGALRR
jgi:hypothetical protein